MIKRFAFLSVLILVIALLQDCGSVGETSSQNESDAETHFILTSKGVFAWELSNNGETGIQLNIMNAEKNQLYASTLLAADSGKFEFRYQQTGDKLWFVDPSGELKGMIVDEGRVTENHRVLRSKFPNLKSDIMLVQDARPQLNHGYLITCLDSSRFYFDNFDMLMMDEAAVKMMPYTVKSYLISDLFCAQQAKTCCGEKLYYVSENSSAVSPNTVNKSNLTAYIAGIKEDSVFLEPLNLVPRFSRATVMLNSSHHAFVLWEANEKLFFNCISYRDRKLKWSTELGTAPQGNCNIYLKNFYASVNGGYVLLAQKKASENAAWKLSVSDGKIVWQTNSKLAKN